MLDYVRQIIAEGGFRLWGSAGILAAMVAVAWPVIKTYLPKSLNLGGLLKTTDPSDPVAALESAVSAYRESLTKLRVSPEEQDRRVAEFLKPVEPTK